MGTKAEENKKKLDELEASLDCESAEKLAEEIDDFDLNDDEIVYSVWAYDGSGGEYKLDAGYTDMAEAKKCFDYVVANAADIAPTVSLDWSSAKITLESYIPSLDTDELLEESEISLKKPLKSAE